MRRLAVVAAMVMMFMMVSLPIATAGSGHTSCQRLGHEISSWAKDNQGVSIRSTDGWLDHWGVETVGEANKLFHTMERFCDQK